MPSVAQVRAALESFWNEHPDGDVDTMVASAGAQSAQPLIVRARLRFRPPMAETWKSVTSHAEGVQIEPVERQAIWNALALAGLVPVEEPAPDSRGVEYPMPPVMSEPPETAQPRGAASNALEELREDTLANQESAPVVGPPAPDLPDEVIKRFKPSPRTDPDDDEPATQEQIEWIRKHLPESKLGISGLHSLIVKHGGAPPFEEKFWPNNIKDCWQYLTRGQVRAIGDEMIVHLRYQRRQAKESTGS